MAATGAFALALGGNLHAGDTTPNTAGEEPVTPAAVILTTYCGNRASDGLGRAAIKQYADDFADGHWKLANNGEQPKSKAEMILERVSFEGSYGNSAVLTANERYWNIEWDDSKWSYALKITVPFDMKQRWEREISAVTSAKERGRQAEESSRNAFIAKILKLRAELERKAHLAAETLALDIATQSESFVENCISSEWRELIPRVDPYKARADRKQEASTRLPRSARGNLFFAESGRR